MPEYEQTFGGYLRELIAASGLSQNAVARNIGVSTGMISQWVRNKRRPEPGNVTKLAMELGVPVREMQIRAGYERRREPARDPKREELLELAQDLPSRELDLAIGFLRWRRAEALRPRRLDTGAAG